MSPQLCRSSHGQQPPKLQPSFGQPSQPPALPRQRLCLELQLRQIVVSRPLQSSLDASAEVVAALKCSLQQQPPPVQLRPAWRPVLLTAQQLPLLLPSSAMHVHARQWRLQVCHNNSGTVRQEQQQWHCGWRCLHHCFHILRWQGRDPPVPKHFGAAGAGEGIASESQMIGYRGLWWSTRGPWTKVEVAEIDLALPSPLHGPSKSRGRACHRSAQSLGMARHPQPTAVPRMKQQRCYRHARRLRP